MSETLETWTEENSGVKVTGMCICSPALARFLSRSDGSDGPTTSNFSPPASPAHPSLSLVDALREMIRAICGPKPAGSYARWDLNGRCWRTLQASLLPTTDDFSELFSATWPKWGIVWDGLLSAPVTWVRPIAGTGCSSFATPSASDAKGNHGGGQNRSLRTDMYEMKHGLWPTVTVYGNHNRAGISEKAGDGLATAANWPTLKSRDHRSASGQAGLLRHDPDLNVAVNLWSTPKATVSGPDFARRNRQGSGGDDLVTQVAMGSLNPDWVETLMGFPVGWSSPDGPLHEGLRSTNGSRLEPFVDGCRIEAPG